MDNFGVRLKSIRSEHSMSQKKFAALIGVKTSYISRLENSTSNPSTSLVKLISKEFDINEEWLETGMGNSRNTEKVNTDANNSTALQIQILKELISYDSSLYAFTFMESIENNFLQMIDIRIVPEENRKDYLQFICETFGAISNISTLLKGTYVTNNSSNLEKMELVEMYKLKFNNILHEIF